MTGTVLIAGSLMITVAAARAGILWVPGMPNVYVDGTPAQYSLPQRNGTQVMLSGENIEYVKARDGSIALARSRGFARLDVRDRFGSYYCRADEIHYRAATNEIILNGRAMVSAVRAPGVQDFGLTRVDLLSSTVEYSSGQLPRDQQALDASSLAAVDTSEHLP